MKDIRHYLTRLRLNPDKIDKPKKEVSFLTFYWRFGDFVCCSLTYLDITIYQYYQYFEYFVTLCTLQFAGATVIQFYQYFDYH
jgi:hypothetical protein